MTVKEVVFMTAVLNKFDCLTKKSCTASDSVVFSSTLGEVVSVCVNYLSHLYISSNGDL